MREKKKEKKGKDFNEDKLVPIIYQDIKQASKQAITRHAGQVM
jgi:hypothetical protein